MKMTQAAVSDQPLTEEEKQLVNEVYERIEVFEQECRPYHDEAKATREVIRLRDPFQDKPGAKEKTLQLQTLKATFNNCVADQMQNMPSARILPESPELQNVADDVQDAVRYVLYDLNSFEALHRRRAEDFFCTGTAITQIVWDESMMNGKGDVALIRWPIESFLWDTKAEDIQDARALIKVSWHPMSWYEAHYPDAAPYVNGEDGQHNQVGVPTSQETRVGTDEPRAMLAEYWYRRYDAKKRKFTINVAYCAGGALLEAQENVFAHGLYPFTMDVHSTIEGQPVGEGLVSELTPMMRYINRYARYIDTNLRMASKGRLLTRRDNGIDKTDLADWSVDVIEGDSVEANHDFAWLQHQPFNGMISQQLSQMQNDLKQDSGANQFTRGETMSGVTAGKAIAALQEAGGKIAGMRTDILNQGFKRMVEQVIWLMAEFYEQERMVLITGKDGQSRQVNMSAKHFYGDKYPKVKGAVAPPPYMVTVEVQKKNPLQVEAQNEMYMQAYTMAAQAKQYFPLSALFRIMNIEGKDRLLPLIEQSEHFTEQMQQLEMQNQQLVEQLGQMQQENESLKRTSTEMTNALASVSAQTGGGFKAAQAGGENTQAGLVDEAREGMAAMM